MNKKLRSLHLFFIITLLISACNMPSGNNEKSVASTAAAQTVQAMLSATPVLNITPSFTPVSAPPTLTLIPMPVNTSTPIASPTSNCNVAQYITDVTIPDGTVMTPGQAFTKKWRIKNIGSCAWNGFSLVFDSGEAMSGPASSAIAVVNPNQEVDLAVNMIAPTTQGTYRGYWRIMTNSSVLVPVVSGYQGRSFYVDIKVQNPTPTPTNTVPAPPAFAVTSVTYSVATFDESAYAGCPIVTANITVNGAGTVTYHFTRSDPSSSTPGTLTFAAAGTQSVTEKWYLNSTAVPSSSGGFWLGIYVDSPNHQDFGHTAISPCTAP